MRALRLLPLLLAATLSAQTPEPEPARTPEPPAQAPAPQPTPQNQTQPTPGTPTTPTQPAPYTLTRTARLVVLDIVVHDAKGNLITDLTREDFHVTEAGEPQQIRTFESTTAHPAPPPDAEIRSTADLDRLAPRAPVNILLLDEFNTRFEDMAFARYSVEQFFKTQPGKLATPTMLVAVSLQNFTVLADFTQDKAAILDALKHHFAAYPWQAHQYSWLSERYATAFITLRRVAEAVIGHPGRKNMIWIGRGFPSLNLANVPIDGQQRVENAVQSCVNLLRSARVTLSTVDPAGLQMDPGLYGQTFGVANDPFGGNYQFNRLAQATGGRTLYGRNDVDAEIGKEVRDGETFYTLTYRPTDDSTDTQKFRRIQVTFDRPGLTATTSQGYYLGRGPGRVDPAKPSRSLAYDLVAADSSTMVYDGVPLTLMPVASDPDAFKIRIDPRAIVWTPAAEDHPRQAALILMASSFDKKGKQLNRVAKEMKIGAPADAPATGRLDRAIVLDYKFPHDPKATRFRFTVRMSATGRIGTADAEPGKALNTSTATTPPAPAPPAN